MRSTIVFTILMMSSMAMASIIDSTLVPRHQDIIRTEIENKCGLFKDLTEVSTTKTTIYVDQIRDYSYVTVLKGKQAYEQNNIEDFEIIVTSHEASMYDHQARDWGAFSVTSVICKAIQ